MSESLLVVLDQKVDIERISELCQDADTDYFCRLTKEVGNAQISLFEAGLMVVSGEPRSFENIIESILKKTRKVHGNIQILESIDISKTEIELGFSINIEELQDELGRSDALPRACLIAIEDVFCSVQKNGQITLHADNIEERVEVLSKLLEKINDFVIREGEDH